MVQNPPSFAPFWPPRCDFQREWLLLTDMNEISRRDSVWKPSKLGTILWTFSRSAVTGKTSRHRQSPLATTFDWTHNIHRKIVYSQYHVKHAEKHHKHRRTNLGKIDFSWFLRFLSSNLRIPMVGMWMGMGDGDSCGAGWRSGSGRKIVFGL